MIPADRNFRLIVTVCCVVVTFTNIVGSTGFRGRVTRRGLDYGSQVAVDMLMKLLPIAEIPELYDHMGSMSTVLSNVTLKDFSRPTLRVDLIPNSTSSFAGLRVTFSRLDPVIECDLTMTYDFGLFTTQRQLFVTITTSNLTLTLEALVGTDGDGNAVPGRISCNIEGDVRMASGAETGTLGSVFDFMTNTLNQRMKAFMFHQACTNITALVNDSLHRELTAANMSRIVLDDEYFLDLKFTEPPAATESYFEASHVAQLQLRNDSAPTNRQFSVPAIPAFAEHTSKMTYAFVTNDVLNAAWSAAFRNKKLTYTVKSNTPDLPKPMRRFLTTRCFKRNLGCLGTVFPQLTALYPRSPMELDLDVTESSNRVVRFRGRTLEVATQGTVKFFAKTRQSRDPLFSVAVAVNGQVNVYTRNDRLFFNLTEFSVDSNLTQIHLPNSSSSTNSKFQTYLRTVNRRFLLPYLRKLGSSGYLIPSLPWVKVTDPVIIDSQMENVIILGADFTIDVEAFHIANSSTTLQPHSNRPSL